MKTEILKIQADSATGATLNLAGRVLLSLLFVLAGIGKIGAYAATAGWMASMGVPGALLPLVILLEVGGSIALVLGYQTRLLALLLALFTLVSAFIFHSNLSDQTQFLMFYKNVAIAGGFLAMMLLGGGRFSLDAKLNR
ncbi:DoxX family protein [Gallaecimonas kandeliae]|uniref:DoxX family protein n=1 Tax=Gallaecimonas kandeliae TaxID=3029055 RepID=UPI002648CD94|nr:DoxX family protein [Gallaecimonas kandeliae]WKE66563.1 DoxX family protein [Gallaecimonas kandeliae]